jgi:pyruvate dehydrogenase E1 component
LGANDGAYNQAHFFGSDEELRRLVAHMSPQELDALKRGGHDFRKLYAAFALAREHVGQPTVILAMTKKGYGMGKAGESRMTAHQEKKLDVAALLEFRDRFKLPLSDDDVAELRFLRPSADSEELTYLKERRASLGGYLPIRRAAAAAVAVPSLESYANFALITDGKERSTTTIAVRLISNLLQDKALGPRIVPIVADEARTFGMANLFKQIGIYSPVGQLYEPEDAASLLAYRESRNGQLLEEGITEAGALSSWIAAATSYSVHDLPMLPFYIYYSMFGFQRVGDLIWAAADQRARGFLLGATAGRTTLGGEGLQHQDGQSHVIAATVPNCRAYDPAFGCELAIILDHGARRMLEERADEFFYITVMNESYLQPSVRPDAREGIIKGMYLHEEKHAEGERGRVQLLGSGAILREVIAAAELLARDWQVSSNVFSVTSFSELARDGRETERANRLGRKAYPKRSYVAQCLSDVDPVVAATDYVRAYPQLIAAYVRADFTALGTDGFGRSDTRGALRRFFEVDRHHIAVAALHALSRRNEDFQATVSKAIEHYHIDRDAEAPWKR